MRIKATVVGVYENKRVARAIARAVAPDNEGLPPGFRVSTEQRGSTVRTEIEFDGRVETLLNTLDDLLACTQAAENVLKEKNHKD